MARIAEFHSVDGGSIPPCSAHYELKENRMNNRVSKGCITSKRHKRLWDAEVRRQNYEYYEEMYNWCIKNDMPSLAQWYKLCMEDISK